MATITGTTGDDVLIGTTGDDTYSGFLGGNDVVYDFGGYDTYIMDASFESFVGNDGGSGDGNETIAFTGGQIVFYGAGFDGKGAWGEIEQIILNDFLFRRGSDGNDLMDYSAQAHLVHIEADAGDDSVVGTAFDDEIGAGDGHDLVNAGAGDDMLSVGDGGDTLEGGAGFDTLELHSGGPESFGMQLLDPETGSFLVQSDYGEDSTLLMSGVELVVGSGGIGKVGSAAGEVLVGSDGVYQQAYNSDWQISLTDVLFGMAGNDTLTGGLGNDRLDGGAGSDVMNGGDGDDQYVVDDAADTITDSAGYDAISSSVNWTLGAGLESLLLQHGVSGLAGTGNGGANSLYGNERGNLLDGRGGNDFLEGGGGNDTLVGGAGADNMQGGYGNDAFYVDNVGDSVNDNGNGFDTVYSSISLQVAQLSGPYGGGWVSIEKVVLEGTGSLTIEDSQTVDQWSAARHMVGNSGTNALYGFSGDDTLDGGAGIDSLVGGTGNDTYYVDNVGDAIAELANEGLDVVFSSVACTLSANVEYLVLGGTAAAGTGNAGANTLLGNGAANNLKGLGGADTLEGAGGNDILDGGDSADYVSGGIGSDNLKGGTGNDVLNGGAGNDTLAGAAGNDVLVGGVGADRFLFNTAPGAANADHLQSFTTASDGIQLDDAVFTGLTAGVLAAGRFVLGTAAVDATDRIVYDAGTGSLYYDADGTGATAQVLFAIIDDRAALVAADIVVV